MCLVRQPLGCFITHLAASPFAGAAKIPAQRLPPHRPPVRSPPWKPRRRLAAKPATPRQPPRGLSVCLPPASSSHSVYSESLPCSPRHGPFLARSLVLWTGDSANPHAKEPPQRARPLSSRHAPRNRCRGAYRTRPHHSPRAHHEVVQPRRLQRIVQPLPCQKSRVSNGVDKDAAAAE